MAFFYLFGALD